MTTQEKHYWINDSVAPFWGCYMTCFPQDDAHWQARGYRQVDRATYATFARRTYAKLHRAMNGK